MKSEREIREMIDKLIMWAVECSDAYAEEDYLNRAQILGWVIGINGREIDNQFEEWVEIKYNKK